MIKRIWRWFKRFFQRLFGKKQAVSPQKPQIKEKPRQSLTDTEYESLFLQLLAKVNDEGYTRGALGGFLAAKNIAEADLLGWLRRFGERLLAADGENHQLAERMVRLSEVGCGDLGEVAGEIGRELLGRGGEEEAEGEEEIGEEETQTATLDELLVMIEQDENLRQRVAQQLGIETDHSILMIGELIIQELTETITWFERANQQYDAGDFEGSIASFDKILEFKGDNHKAWNNRAIALKSKVDHDVAWNNRGRALDNLGRYEQAIASYDKALEIKPDHHEAWCSRGVALGNLGRNEEAIASYDKALEIKPDFHDAWNSKGALLCDRLSQYEKAIASFDKALEIKPDFHDAWYNRGYALRKLGRYEQAIASYDKALEIKPDDHEAWYNRGYALVNLGRYEQAIASFDKALEIKPDYHEAWTNRGAALADLGRYEQVIASFDKALEIKPDHHSAWYSRGVALYYLGRYEDAIASYDKALEIKPDYHEAWTNRGVALADLGRNEQAIASYDKALEIKPDLHQAWYNRGDALYCLGRYEDAIASYDKALEIKPDYHEAWINRGARAGKSIGVDRFLATSTILIQNPALNQRGYEGKLASYREGLKHCHQDTHPEGWGKLHQAIGDAHYDQGVGKQNYPLYWLQAKAEYNKALITLTPEAFPELHLEVLRDLIRVLFGLGKDDEAKQSRRQGLKVFGNLLNSPDKSSFQKRQLKAKFSGFSQMRVDVLIEDGDFVSALEAAERNKNFYLTWILDRQKEYILSPSYRNIQGLINPQTAPNTAIIYWHISPFALTTFIIKADADKPIVIPTQQPDRLKAWIKDWDKQYESYRKGKKQQPSNAAWRDNLPQLLRQLSKILNIPDIIESIQNPSSNIQTSQIKIQNLILIPHRDLHRFPLHALFLDDFSINYLPSAQIGLNLISKSQKLHQDSQQKFISSPNLLIVEYSGEGRQDEGLERLTYAEMESAAIAQIFANFDRTNSKLIPDSQANKTVVKQALSAGYNIFHFTGHGSYDSKSPKESALYLRRETDTETNPDLTLPEIDNLNLSGYQLVSLSACETAITGNQTIEAEYVGLVSAFLDRGVSYVVSSLWTVNEISTSLLMIYFYRQIKKGKAPNVALAIATKWLRNLNYQKLEKFYRFSIRKLGVGNSSRIILETYLESVKGNKGKLFDHPYHWSGFTVTGI